MGEIEAALLTHPNVQECVVLAREDVRGDQRLVAYVVSNEGLVTGKVNLREFLKEKLPEYMIPSAFVLLKNLPLTSNGKVDRQSLPVQAQYEREETFVPPQNEIERAIANVWQELLRLEKVGIHDNFFDLGGHSILMVQVHSKLRQVLNRELSMVEMFQYPTISALAKHLSHSSESQSDIVPTDEIVETRRESRKQQRQLRQNYRGGNQ